MDANSPVWITSDSSQFTPKIRHAPSEDYGREKQNKEGSRQIRMLKKKKPTTTWFIVNTAYCYN